MPLRVLFIVRRYATSGGMEKYVWELTNALARQGIDVHVLCESVELPPTVKTIQVHQLNVAFPKPRWLAMLKFSHRVSNWLQSQKDQPWIIHSHERSVAHHVTTFHGPPFANIYSKPWWQRISVRVKVWLFLEQRELCANNVQFVLPNSDYISQQLIDYYPCSRRRILEPAYPGVHRNQQVFTKEKNSIVFVGKEWKRKGLVKAISIVEVLRNINKDIRFSVVGPEPKEIQHLFSHWGDGYELLGWVDAQPVLEKATLLLHPAEVEPYGMVVAEASNLGARVVVSSRCGIANQVCADAGQVVHVDESVDIWVSACLEELANPKQAQMIGGDWDELAQQHVEVYQRVKL